MNTPDPPLSPTLPPYGQVTAENQGMVWAWLSRFAKEADNGSVEWIGVQDQCIRIYTHGSDPAPAPGQTSVNEIQDSVISQTDTQTKEPITAAIEAPETGAAPAYYWTGPTFVARALGIPPQCVTGQPNPLDPAETLPPQPLDPFLGETLVDLAASGAILPVANPALPLLNLPLKMKEDWVTVVSEDAVAAVYQAVLDRLWERTRMDQRIRTNLLHTNILGWTLWHYEWDDARKLPVVRETSARQVKIDPTKESIDDSSYLILDMVLDADEAKALYPQLADFVDRNAAPGYPTRTDQNTDFGQANDRTYERATVTLRVAWLRNQPFPLDPADAIADGHVEAREIVDPADELAAMHPDQPGSPNDPFAQDGPLGNGVPLPLPPGGGGGGVDPVGGVSAGGPDRPANPPPDTAHFLAGTDTRVTPDHPQWPTRLGVRQLVAIARVDSGRIISDAECPHADIPVLHNRNIPVLNTPFGMGEPYRLTSLQNASNRVIDNLVKNGDAFRSPLEILPTSIANLNRKAFGTAYVKHGQVIEMPDDDVAKWGPFMKDFIVPPPPMPEGLMQLEPLLRQRLRESSGHVDSMRGVAQGDMSGKAIQSLQAGASSLMGFKAQSTADMVHRLVRLIIHNIRQHMGVDEVYDIVKKYPRHILQAILDLGLTAEYGCRVTVPGGTASMIAQKKQEAIVQNQTFDPLTRKPLLSLESTRERLNIDHKLEERRNGAAAAGGGPAMPMVPPPTATNSGPPPAAA